MLWLCIFERWCCVWKYCMLLALLLVHLFICWAGGFGRSLIHSFNQHSCVRIHFYLSVVYFFLTTLFLLDRAFAVIFPHFSLIVCVCVCMCIIFSIVLSPSHSFFLFIFLSPPLTLSLFPFVSCCCCCVVCLTFVNYAIPCHRRRCCCYCFYGTLAVA